jgi:hypothetical protein
MFQLPAQRRPLPPSYEDTIEYYRQRPPPPSYEDTIKQHRVTALPFDPAIVSVGQAQSVTRRNNDDEEESNRVIIDDSDEEESNVIIDDDEEDTHELLRNSSRYVLENNLTVNSENYDEAQIDFTNKKLLLNGQLRNFTHRNDGYWSRYFNKNNQLFANQVQISDENSFKIFLKINGKYVLFFVNLLDKLFGNMIHQFKICNELFRKRYPHKQFITYFEINDPIFVVYFSYNGNSRPVQELYERKTLYKYENAQKNMIDFIEKINDILGDDIDKYLNAPHPNNMRNRFTDGQETFTDYLQPIIYDGPSFTKYLNKLFNYAQGGFTESKKDEILQRNNIDNNYFIGNINQAKKINNATALFEFMEKFDGEYFYKNKDTFDILNNYKFIASIEKTKNLDFQMNNLLWTHNRPENIFQEQLEGNFGNKSNLVNETHCPGRDRKVVNFRYGLDSQYGEIIFVMKPDFFDKLENRNFFRRDGTLINMKSLYSLYTDEVIDATNIFYINMHLKATALLSNYRDKKTNQYTVACNSNASNITRSIRTLENLLGLANIQNKNEKIQNLINSTTIANKYLFNNDILTNAQYHYEWCNYQIHICGNITVKDHVLAIIVPKTISERTKRLIDSDIDIKNKIIEVDVSDNLFIYNSRNTIVDPPESDKINMYRRHDCVSRNAPPDCNAGIRLTGNSSLISLSPSAFKKYQDTYYQLIRREIEKRNLVGGKYYKYKYQKYCEKCTKL